MMGVSVKPPEESEATIHLEDMSAQVNVEA